MRNPEERPLLPCRAPALLWCKRIGKIQHSAIGVIDDALPVATPGSTLDCRATDDLPANARAAGRWRLKHCQQILLVFIDAVIEHASRSTR